MGVPPFPFAGGSKGPGKQSLGWMLLPLQPAALGHSLVAGGLRTAKGSGPRLAQPLLVKETAEFIILGVETHQLAPRTAEPCFQSCSA